MSRYLNMSRFGLGGERQNIGRYISAVLTALVMGAAGTFFIDPERGRRRRVRAADRVRSITSRSGYLITSAAHHLKNHANGLIFEVRALFEGGDVPDEVLAERVRSKLGRVVTHIGALKVSADVGRIFLRGQILEPELKPAIRAALKVHGVSEVIDRLEVHENPGEVTSLEGRAASVSDHGLPHTVKMYNPLLSSITAAVLIAAGMRQHGVARFGFASAGVIVLAKVMRGSLIKEGQEAVEVEDRSLGREQAGEQVPQYLH